MSKEGGVKNRKKNQSQNVTKNNPQKKQKNEKKETKSSKEKKNMPKKNEKKLEIAPDSSPKGFWHKMMTRSLFGSLMIMGFGVMLYVGHMSFLGFLLVGQVVGWKEIMDVRYNAEKEKKIVWFRSLQWYMLFVTVFFLYLVPVCYFGREFIPANVFELIVKYHKATSFALYVIGFVAFILSLRKESYRYQFGQLTWTMMTNMIFVGQAYFGVHNILQGLIWIVLPPTLIIINDIAAYFCGVAFGKKIINRPLIELSPNKTWEGVIGATFFTVILGFLLAKPMAGYDWLICPRPSYGHPVSGCQPHLVFLPKIYDVPEIFAGFYGSPTIELLPLQVHTVFFALFASIIGPFGGLFASGIKRAYGKKDFAGFIPGHGGIIDRFDCQYLMVVFVYVYLVTFVGAGVLKPEQIIYQFSTMGTEDQLRVFNSLKQIIGQ